MYDLNDISIHSGITATQLEGAVNALKADNGLKGLGEYFINAENEYNINAVVLMAIACLESGYGTSELAKKKNNLFGLKADDDKRGTDEYGETFDSYEDNINTAAFRLGCQYIVLDPEVAWRYCGSKKLSDVGRIYCTSKDWASKVANLCERLESNISYEDVSEEVEINDGIDWKSKYEMLVQDLENLINSYKGEM